MASVLNFNFLLGILFGLTVITIFLAYYYKKERKEVIKKDTSLNFNFLVNIKNRIKKIFKKKND